MVPSTLLAPAIQIRTDTATEIHTLTPLTYELFFQNSSIIGTFSARVSEERGTTALGVVGSERGTFC